MGYTEKVIQHFENPQNLGSMDDADASAKVGSAVCGDIVKYYIKVSKEGEKIVDIKFRSYGCASNIATSSILTEMVKGKPLTEAKRISFKDVEKELGGLPTVKMHCAVLAVQALKIAIAKYEVKQGKRELDEDFCRQMLQGVMDPITGDNILEVEKVENIDVTNNEVTIILSISEESETAKNIKTDIVEAFKDIDIKLFVEFRDEEKEEGR